MTGSDGISTYSQDLVVINAMMRGDQRIVGNRELSENADRGNDDFIIIAAVFATNIVHFRFKTIFDFPNVMRKHKMQTIANHDRDVFV